MVPGRRGRETARTKSGYAFSKNKLLQMISLESWSDQKTETGVWPVSVHDLDSAQNWRVLAELSRGAAERLW